jgi:hypothetical protein
MTSGTVAILVVDSTPRQNRKHLGRLDMQGTVVMLLALSGLGCHHKKCAPVVAETCYSSSSCYSSGCYSSCYSGSSCYSSCYSSGYSSCYSSCYSGAAYSPAEYSCYSCYSSCYSAPRHKHGLFGHKRKSCSACCAPAPVAAPACDACSTYGGPPVYGTYTPVYDGYASGQYIGSGQSYTPPMSGQAMPAPKPADLAPAAPEAPSPGNPAPAAPVPAAPAPAPTTPPTPPPAE